MTDGDGMLAGVRVVELGQIAAGPFASLLLADLGADVVKVERPGTGDGMRGWPPLMENTDGETYSGNFASLNRNKRSIAIDLKDPEQLASLRSLCLCADVVIENYRPGVLARVGLGYGNLAVESPGLVYCSLSGYGQDGPYAQRGAFDVTIQAISGVMSVTGDEDGQAAKCGVPIGDFVAGLYAAYCVMAALRRVEAGGPGAYIDCAMLGALLGVSALQTSEYFGTGLAPRRLGSAHPRNAPYQAFDASDGPLVVAAGTEELWRRLCSIMRVEQLVDDPRFATQPARARNQRALAAALAPVFATRAVDEWLDVLDRAGIPCAPINDYPAVLADPHVANAGWVTELELPNGVVTSTVPFPVRVDGETGAVRRRPPRLGEHTDEVLAEWLAPVR